MMQMPEPDTYSENYFDALYSDNTDPWHYQTRWYEKRKRDICLAVLPQAHYTHALELGCGNGVFSALLAARCQHLTSMDGNAKAVQLAKQNLKELPQVKVVKGIIPSALLRLEKIPLTTTESDSGFNLIVISEILYYLSLADIDLVIDWIKQNLAVGGTLLCCHWRYDIEGFEMTGESVHQRLYQAFKVDTGLSNHSDDQTTFNHQSAIVDTDFLLDIWQNSANSVAMQENLV